MPPLQISRSVTAHVSHANRLSQRVDLPEFPQFILEKITANGADFADGFLVAVALWATRHNCCFYFSTALRTAKRLQLRTRRSGRCGRVVQLLRRMRRSSSALRVATRRLGCAWRENCAGWCPTYRFARRALRGRGRSCLCAGKLGALFQPRLVILRCIDDQCAFHSVMAKPTQLSANHFIGSCLNRREPDWN